MDHSGCLSEVMRLANKAQLIVSKRGMDSFPGHYHQNWNFRAVGTGERINIGSGELVFFEAPMLHWPDSMFTFLTGRNILMPNDAFGQHYAAAFRFNDQVNREELYQEALKYYTNIITPFSEQVLRKIDELLAMKLPLEMIAPSHGIIWRKDPLQIVTTYQDWARQKPSKYAVIVFDSMWHATRRMAEGVGEGLKEGGVDHRIYHMAVSDRNDVLTEIFKAGAVVIGSPTLNRGLLPSITPILEDLKGLRFKNKIGAAFGSYGWSGESVKQIEEHLAKCQIPVAAPGVLAKWQPTGEDMEKCRKMGAEIAAKLQTI
jgi:flavorubredoxin